MLPKWKPKPVLLTASLADSSLFLLKSCISLQLGGLDLTKMQEQDELLQVRDIFEQHYFLRLVQYHAGQSLRIRIINYGPKRN